ncbi:hypothetical protein LOTGIDRAFT_175717 [Lottia gigantea]|uniref:Uncharacterized protein n=1 Tax=Lottia gigantea TaxID=225164 RepID=V4AB02_LOTGI|nr:hypothetical protein LOTGIDRAFT_175717 [Lottia gigantea]ESO92275.1 hypothetical protein LOTGIDRAFT_175717 [Lottia gigantea]
MAEIKEEIQTNGKKTSGKKGRKPNDKCRNSNEEVEITIKGRNPNQKTKVEIATRRKRTPDERQKSQQKAKDLQMKKAENPIGRNLDEKQNSKRQAEFPTQRKRQFQTKKGRKPNDKGRNIDVRQKSKRKEKDRIPDEKQN